MENNSAPPWQNALRQLPQYTPPPEVWQGIDAALTAEAPLHAAIKHLPQYAAPATAWSNIVAQLEQPPVRKLRWFQPALPWAAAAAVVLTLAFLGAWWRQEDQPLETVVYRQEKSAAVLVASTDPAVESDIASAKAVYQQYSQIQSPTMDLETAMEELEQAKIELEAAMATYGVAPDLVRQLDRIEIDRAKLAREMAAVALY